MGIVQLKRLLLFVGLCLLQVLVFNQILLFGCAIPLLYIYFIMRFEPSASRWSVLLWGFFLGLSVDIFSNTPGVAAGSATLLALLQPYFLVMFTPRDSDENLDPGISSLSFSSFAYYTILCVFVYCVAFFSLEAFSFFYWQQWLLCICGSTVLTSVLILVIESFRVK